MTGQSVDVDVLIAEVKRLKGEVLRLEYDAEGIMDRLEAVSHHRRHGILRRIAACYCLGCGRREPHGRCKCNGRVARTTAGGG
jgi:hypothetical protein